jgi:hypothetical protein
MRRIHWALVLLGLIITATTARAQGIFIYNPPPYDYGIGGASITLTRHKHHGGLSLTFGYAGVPAISLGQLYFPYTPPLLFPPLYGPVVNQQITVVNYRPAPAVLPAPLFVNDDLTRAIMPRPDEPVFPLNPRPLPDRTKPKKPEPEAAPAPRPEPPPPKPPPPKPPVMREPPQLEPRSENARLIELGKEAFAETAYGLAAQRFHQAATVLPADPTAQFLLAQALLALGKYQDAMDAVNAGMVLEPNWPTFNFRPLDLYGAHVALYPEHLQRLADVAERFPNDPAVLFMSGYALWFDGRKDEAPDFFHKAQKAGADPNVIDNFLRSLPPAGGV